MKLTLKQLLEKSDSLQKLLSKDLPVKTAYRLGRLSNAVRSELTQYQEHRNKLIKKYGKETNGNFEIDKDDKDAIENFTKDNDDLLAVEIKIDSYEPITLDELGEIKLSSIDMGNLEIFFSQ